MTWQMSVQFEITDTDVDRYVRRKSTGEIGWIERDLGNGWLHPSMKYEWQHIREDFEYVCVNGIDHRNFR
jgi:hypothetical protein